PRGIYYTPTTGIWQTVWLEPVADSHVDSLEITPDVDRGVVHLGGKVAGRSIAEVTVTDPVTKQGVTRTLDLSKGDDFPIREAKLWSPDSPSLYSLKVRLLAP